jgi:hypothetical protein
MKNLPPPTGRQFHLPHAKKTSFCLAALVLLACLLTACIPQMADSPESAATPTLTIRPQTADPTATLHPTVTADHEETSERTALPTPEPLDTPDEPTAGTPVEGEVPPDLLQALLNDLAERLGLPVNQITVVHSHVTEWNDCSLGCPQPDMLYLQVITPGFRVVLAAQDQIYNYHTDRRGSFILCSEYGLPSEPIPLMPIAPHGKPPKCTQPPCP